ncbi:ATP-binding protein [Thermodesulfobacteriota bacterium]
MAESQNIYHRELHTLLKFSSLINSSLNIEEVLDYAMRATEEFMDVEAGSIYELDEGSGQIFIRLARGEKKDPIKNIRLQVGEGIAGWVIQTGKPMVVQDVRQEKRFSDKFDKITGFKTRSMICVPLMLRDRPMGAIQVLNKKARGLFNQADLELLTGMAQQVAVAMENATLYQRLEKKFEFTTRELKTTQQRLLRSERLAAMGHLIQGVAHEIRNPVMTIGGFARRIKNQLGENPKPQNYLDIIVDEANRLEELVKKIQEFSALQSVSFGLGHIEDVIEAVLLKIKPLIDRQKVVFKKTIDSDIPAVKMDSDQLKIALLNLMENALESMPDGGTLALEVRLENRFILVTLRDGGCGMPTKQLDEIYDPFVSTKTRGAGLGLTMVHQIIMNHQGEITMSSRVGKGTTVRIKNPIFL